MKPEEITIQRLEASDFSVGLDTADELRRCLQHLRELEGSINVALPKRLYKVDCWISSHFRTAIPCVRGAGSLATEILFLKMCRLCLDALRSKCEPRTNRG